MDNTPLLGIVTSFLTGIIAKKVYDNMTKQKSLIGRVGQNGIVSQNLVTAVLSTSDTVLVGENRMDWSELYST